MQERDEIIDELKHLIRYYQQAAHEFLMMPQMNLRKDLKLFTAVWKKIKIHWMIIERCPILSLLRRRLLKKRRTILPI